MDMVITKGKIKKAKKVCIYGPEGIGKSTFVSKFPDPLFIDTEGSTANLDVKRLQNPSSWTFLFQEIDYVIQHPDVCKTLIIDTIDWAEELAIRHICERDGKFGIESYGYGNGYVYVKEELGKLLNKLNDVVDKGINVVLTAHAQIRKFEQPDEIGAYDRYELKLGKKTSSQTSPLIKEWVDMLLFANYKTLSVATDDKSKRFKAGGGKRVMYASHHPCWDAKNRYGLPDECEFSYETIRHIIEDVPLTNLQPTEPVIEKPTSITTPKQEEQQQQSAILEEDMNKLPKPLADLMKQDQVSVFELQQAIAKKGFFPEETPIENIPLEFWKMTVANWDKFRDFITEMNLQF